MSMTLNLEVASGVSLDDIKTVLTSLKCADLSESDHGLTAVLPDTNATVTAKTDIDNTSVLTEDIEDADWKVGLRMYFDVDPTRANALNDVRKFVTHLSEQTPFEFALSFQYESLYAKRDNAGLTLSEDFLSS